MGQEPAASAGATGNEAWTTRRLLAWMSEAFAKAGLESPRLQAEMLLGHVIGCQRLRLFTEPERLASEEERVRLRGLVGRALRHEPIDYLVGERAFFGMAFAVDRRVLVPRPSTETVVEYVLQAARRAQSEAGEGDVEGRGLDASAKPGRAADPGRRPEQPSERVFGLEDREGGALSAFRPSEEDLEEEAEEELEKPVVKKLDAARAVAARPPVGRGTPVAKRGRAAGPSWRIADVCTGSGCIAVAIAKHLGRARVVATDVSGEALEVARENARRHGVLERVEFRKGDLLGPLRGESFDVIVSNPPYIPDEEWGGVAPNVRDHEPTIALRGGADGMAMAGPLIEGAAACLRPGGMLVVEVATSRVALAAEAAHRAGFAGVAILRDCDGLERVVVGRRVS